MYKILLADDEQIVIDSLSFIFERNFPGQLELFSARSGRDAITVCQNNKIDIAFMDINMPGLNGIEAIKDIKAFNPSLLVIVLTAFDRFEYAQQAVNLGVFEYLSKPVNRNKIAETMRSALSTVDIYRRKQQSEIQIREKLDSVVNIVESDFIYSLIFPSDKTGDIESYLDFFNITDPCFYFMTMEISDIPEKERASIYQTIRDSISSSINSIIGPLMRNRIVVFVPVDREVFSTSCESLEERTSFVNSLHSRLATRLGLKVKIGVSSVVSDLSQSLSVYNESLKALISIEEASAVVYGSDSTEVLSESSSYPTEMEKKLLDRSASGDVQTVHSLFNSVCSWIHVQYPNDILVLKTKLFEILILVRYQTRAVQSRFGGFSVWKDTWKQIENMKDSVQLEKFVLAEIDECLGVISEYKQSRMSPLIIKACTIINENLSSEISLEEISKRVEISPFYFSKLFKEETGENFIEYITMARMQCAKELLRDQSRSIKEISADAGYADPNYFSKLFKKVVGMTPTEYRELV